MIERLVDELTRVATQIIAAIPSVVLALVIILIGYGIGVVVKGAIRLLFNRVLGRFLERTAVGIRLKEAGIDLGRLIGTFIFVLIVAISIMFAIDAAGLPGGEFIRTFIIIVINVLGGFVVLSIGIPLAVLGAEYLAKLVALPLRDKHEVFENLTSTALSVILILFVFGIAISIMFATPNLLTTLTTALPSGIMAGIIVVIGYIIADIVGKFVKSIVESVSKPLEETDVGKALKDAGIETPSLVAGLVKATVIVIAIAVGLGMIGATGLVGDILSTAAFYLPRILATAALLTLGLALVVILAKYIGRLFRAVAKEKFEPLAHLAENLIAIGLVAVLVTIALNILGLLGNLVYALIMGSIVLVIGIMVVDVLTRMLKEVHPAYEKLVPVVGVTIALVFAYVGMSAILLQIPGASEVLRTVGWGIAIAFAVVLIPIVFYFAKTAWKEASTT
ncbi:MAG: hypothetical protein QW101_04760 [Ignisphaera sp.]|uniref:Uncharacterized protein n=1 Tax=Ignisphaera aggregans TaxID=334771 RepID=A0A7J3MX94_9CREN